MKTFWVGADGWSDEQLPDGTVIWTAPSRATYKTHPGGKLLVPTLSLPTGTPPPPRPTTAPAPNRGAMMPQRRRTRAQDRLNRILTERRQ
jgi:hypothetical protein